MKDVSGVRPPASGRGTGKLIVGWAFVVFSWYRAMTEHATWLTAIACIASAIVLYDTVLRILEFRRSRARAGERSAT